MYYTRPKRVEASGAINVGGIFLPLLAILFIGLKLSGHIAWSWWWVLAPLWIPVVVIALVFLYCLWRA